MRAQSNPDTIRTNVKRHESKRLRVLSVNLDGLTTVVYDTLANWMQTAPYDVLLLQETHRGFGAEQAEWKMGQWTMISSPDPKTRFAGVAIAIRTTIVAHFTARCLPVIPGRLLHVRLSGDTYSIDLLSCYQHVISSREQRHINASKREQFWTKLGSYTASLPQRNLLIVAQLGDDFVGYAQANSLCFLNTWSRGGQQDMNTFINGSSKSQIDYILTRRFQADSLARRARPVAGLDFSPWRLGAKHRPVETSLPLKPGWAGARQKPQISQPYDKQQLELSLHLADSKADMLRDRVEQVRTSLGEMWRQVLWAFRAYAAFQRSYREVRRRGLWHRKQRLHQQLELARQAETSKDTRLLYQVVREIAPKMQGGRVRIRSVAGEVLTAEEEHAEISEYFRKLFSLIPHEIEPLPRLEPLILEIQELYSSLGKLGKGMAVPRLHARSSVWRFCRQQLCGPLLEAFHSETAAGYPGRWADCNLALIPKPGKTIKRPESLRPLGIQDAAGKAIAQVLKERLFLQVRDTLEQFPQYAYLSNRSAQDAIQRVTEHCSLIRSRVVQDRHNIYNKKSGKTRSKYVGGAQLALDMTTAFDRLPRAALKEALEWANVEPSLVSIILELHCACRYRIEHEGLVSYVDMSNGVRQGCTLAPLLWALFSAFLLHKIEVKLESAWPRESMTLYADDTHCAWNLASAKDLSFFIQSAVAVLEVYQEYGMKVNTEKSALIIRLAGTHGAKWLKRHIEVIEGKPHFLLASGLRVFRVPVVQKVKYLGIIISYKNYETEVAACFQHMQEMEVDAALGKREATALAENTAEKDGEPQPKHPRPLSKGQGGQGKGGKAANPEPSAPSSGHPNREATTSDPKKAGQDDPLTAAAAAFGQTGQQARSQGRQQQQQQGWRNSQGQRRGWSSYQWGGQRKTKEEQAWEDNLRLLARLCLRHEDELSQTRVERDFVLTMETQEAAVLTKLYRLAQAWRVKKDKQEVTCSLRVCLFMGLLQVWLERMRALEVPGDEAEALRKSIVDKGYAQMPEGTTELQWLYLRWNSTTKALEKVPDAEPMFQSQVVTMLVQLQATREAPNALLRFRSTRRMAEEYAGETVTFLLTVGHRDPMAAQAWGMLTNLCGNGAGKVIGLKMKPAKMDRQPLAKVVAERFPPPPPANRASSSQQGRDEPTQHHEPEQELH
ncbi:unnamed protein product [Symbiodinium sp. CCMP2592]|nr:unnamed protein product [Symbiodinium sp. CCMP2592]